MGGAETVRTHACSARACTAMGLLVVTRARATEVPSSPAATEVSTRTESQPMTALGLGLGLGLGSGLGLGLGLGLELELGSGLEDGEPAYDGVVAETRLQQHLTLLARVGVGGWLSWD